MMCYCGCYRFLPQQTGANSFTVFLFSVASPFWATSSYFLTILSFFSFSTAFDSSLLSNIQKLFSERIEIFSSVEFSKVSVLTGIVKIGLKVQWRKRVVEYFVGKGLDSEGKIESNQILVPFKENQMSYHTRFSICWGKSDLTASLQKSYSSNSKSLMLGGVEWTSLRPGSLVGKKANNGRKKRKKIGERGTVERDRSSSIPR